jgi:ribulose-phosphate 3-epimerase
LRSTVPVILPSLLLCDFGHLADEVGRLEESGVQALHLDVMDGHFVPNLTYGMLIVEAVRKLTELPIETHLMISEPERYADRFIDSGATVVTFHYEAVDDPRPLLDAIRARGAVAGLAFNPQTPVSAIQPALAHCDVVLTMSVTPGFGNQKFEPVAIDKLRELAGLVGPEVLLEVDGGIHPGTIGLCAAAGARAFAVGSAIFQHPPYSESIATLVRSAEQSTP